MKRHPTFQPGDEAHQTSLSITFAGILNLTVRDRNEYPPPSNYYDDNSGVYIPNVFVIDPEQEAGFNRFKDALFKANTEDSSARAYLGN